MHLLAVGDNANKLMWIPNVFAEVFRDELRKCGLKSLEMFEPEHGIRLECLLGDLAREDA